MDSSTSVTSESLSPLAITDKRQAQSNQESNLTFTRTGTARSVCWQDCGSPEGPLQVIVLLRQLLEGLFQSNALISFILQRLLPFLTMRLS